MATNTATQSLELHYSRRRWQPTNVCVEYDRREDMLYVYALPRVKAGGVYLTGPRDDEILALVAVDGEVVGYQIENFRSVWLKQHPEAQASFRETRKPLSRLLRATSANFTHIIVNSLTKETERADHHISFA